MTHTLSPESKHFIENICEYLHRAVDEECLQILLTHDKVWQIFTAEAKLSSYEAEMLHDVLYEHTMILTAEDRDKLQRNLWARNKFLEMFPQVKTELEECVQKLHALADQVDQVHRDCTISSSATSSTGTGSGTRTLLGLALTPFRVGSSFLLSAAGLGQGALTPAANPATIMREQRGPGAAEAEARHLMSTSKEKVKEFVDAMNKIEPRVPHASVNNLIEAIRRCGIKRERAYSDLVADVIHFITSWGTASHLVQQIIGAIVLAVKRVGITGMVTTVFSLLGDLYHTVHDSRDWQESTRAAEELRKKANMLERKLEELTEIHESLRSDLTQ
ncbi:apolipoprotein L3-like [Octodon degus]|uniref:Apolipoprotein L3-like n=1 Tax=Octodon degus TaxID=10160 RepID=A0A6P6ERC6_OCTDE|nr:apolipoprotein L3-like [Octodon degus]